MKSIMLCLAVVAGVVVSGQPHWETFKRFHGKEYSGDEELRRKSIFESNLIKINDHNLKYDLGLTSYRLGVNRFTDLTNEEFRTLVLRPFNTSSIVHKPIERSVVTDLPDSVDWRDKGYVTPVRDQGQCGSSSLFEATGSLEGCNAVKHGALVPLSVQNLIDCIDGDNGCNGGLASNAFEYCVKNGGIDTEASYPFTGIPSPCKFSVNGIGAKCSGYVDVTTGDELALEAGVANAGPVLAIIDASRMSFQMYIGGVYDDPECSSVNLDHAVLIVGYGSEAEKDYWIVKNSWGVSWGEKGYIRMSRNKNNQCGIATMASYPTMI